MERYNFFVHIQSCYFKSRPNHKLCYLPLYLCIFLEHFTIPKVFHTQYFNPLLHAIYDLSIISLFSNVIKPFIQDHALVRKEQGFHPVLCSLFIMLQWSSRINYEAYLKEQNNKGRFINIRR